MREQSAAYNERLGVMAAEEFGGIKKGEPIKNMYNRQFFDRFTKDLKCVINDFDACKFVSQITYNTFPPNVSQQISK